MRMDEDEELLKKACKKAGCYCPPYWKFATERADTPMYLRVFFEEKAKEQILKEIEKIRDNLEVDQESCDYIIKELKKRLK